MVESHKSTSLIINSDKQLHNLRRQNLTTSHRLIKANNNGNIWNCPKLVGETTHATRVRLELRYSAHRRSVGTPSQERMAVFMLETLKSSRRI